MVENGAGGRGSTSFGPGMWGRVPWMGEVHGLQENVLQGLAHAGARYAARQMSLALAAWHGALKAQSLLDLVHLEIDYLEQSGRLALDTSEAFLTHVGRTDQDRLVHLPIE
jgi:hypothetical protein